MSASRIPPWLFSATLVQATCDVPAVSPGRAWEKMWTTRPIPTNMVFRVCRIDNDPRNPQCPLLLYVPGQDGVLAVHYEPNPPVLRLLERLRDISKTVGGILAGAKVADAVSPSLVLAVLLDRGIVPLEGIQAAVETARTLSPTDLGRLPREMGMPSSSLRVG